MNPKPQFLLPVVFLSCMLVPVQSTLGSPDQPSFEPQSNDPFLNLAHLELTHDFWSKFLDSISIALLVRIYSDLKEKAFLSDLTIECSDRECERRVEVMKTGFVHITKDIVPEEFWEQHLSMFYSKVLTLDEAQFYRMTYQNLAGTGAEVKLGQVHAAFVSEVLPDLLPQIRTMAQAFKIPSGAMAPTFLTGDHIVVNKLAYREQSPDRGDIIVFRFPEDESKTFVKRVIGLPKNRIEIRDKIVYVDGQNLQEDYPIQHTDAQTIDRAVNPRDNIGPVTVPENSYFVLGDNREESLDSRFWGYVRRDQIIGKVSMIYWSWDETAKTPRWERSGNRIR